ncbi:phosphoglycolate phosphatase [Methanorbis rubei]|uniref:Phosphoglycolate phosphatase n=1 Tax=Methanorbis rubei TaxID=3028300 RepID=A0AAE4SCU2_9EURY|nr:5-amino-6-(5-phospho-D-ribitylamino)uracil phosphatase YcsE [Methanocorpusculaceae archaeon Cs1]
MPKAFITDIDGTLTDDRRRLSTRAVEEIRRVVDAGIPVVLASGNTLCFIDALSKMIGTEGDVIAENGGVYRHGYTGDRHSAGDRELCFAAYQKIIDTFQPKGEELRLYSNDYRYSDVAFARDADVDEIKKLLADMPVQVVDTGFAIHLQSEGLSKGAALEKLAELMGLVPADFLAAGDSINDVSMLKAAGIAVTPANAGPEARAAADFVMSKPFGEGTADALARYFP